MEYWDSTKYCVKYWQDQLNLITLKNKNTKAAQHSAHLPWNRAQAKVIGRALVIKYFLVCDQNNEKLKYLTEPFFLSHWFPLWGEL